jgi:hypothetical protein
MNKIRSSGFAAALALALTAGSLQAQTSIQRLTFSLLGEYETNVLFTNTANPAGTVTNENAFIRDILIGTGNVIKALAVDLEGTNFATWTGGTLVREVNLTNGHEGIFLRKGGNQTNVSSFFGGSFSNNFMGEVTNGFSGAASNFIPQLLLNHGELRMSNPTNTTTNFLSTGGLYFVSLNTTNLKLNFVAVGDGTVTTVAGRINGTLYERAVESQFLGTAGTFYLNTTTNVYSAGSNAPVYLTGVLRGTFSTTPPSFSDIPGP